MYVDVLWALQWCHEVKVGYIYRHEHGSFCRNYDVEEDFGNVHICRGCGYFTWVVYFVSAYGEYRSVLFFFLWLYTAHEFPVCHIISSIVWYFVSCYERDSVSWVFMRPPTPFASRPNSFAEGVIQLFFNFGFLISCL